MSLPTPMEKPHCSQNSSKSEHRAPPGGESRYCIPSQQSSFQDTGHIRCTLSLLLQSEEALPPLLDDGKCHPLWKVSQLSLLCPLPHCQIEFEIISKFGFLPTFSRQTDMGRSRTSNCLSPTWETRRGQGQSHLFPGCYSSSLHLNSPQGYILSWVRRYVYIFFWIFQNMN